MKMVESMKQRLELATSRREKEYAALGTRIEAIIAEVDEVRGQNIELGENLAELDTVVEEQRRAAADG